jgi:iron-regulated transporter 1
LCNGVVRTLASICFSSAVGRRVDNEKHRLKTLLSTISINRISVISASVLWLCIINSGDRDISLDNPQPILKWMTFIIILILGIFEGLSASGNMMSMERDWVVTAASPDGQKYDLSHLNSVMRRIDLICKLISPLVISGIISITSTRAGVIVVGAMSATSWGAESWCARRVWNQNSKLKEPKLIIARNGEDYSQSATPRIFSAKVLQAFKRYYQDLIAYFTSTVWIPSLSLALLHLSALSYSATFITFLLSVGFSLEFITIARAAGSLVEISSTVITPVGIRILGKARHHGLVRAHNEFRSSNDVNTPLVGDIREHEMRTETGLERLGAWGLSWQLLNLVSTVSDYRPISY